MQRAIYTNSLWSATAPVNGNPFSPEILIVCLADSNLNRIAKRRTRSRLRAPAVIRGLYPFQRSIRSHGTGW